MPRKILIITGDAGEAYETLYAYHRFLEAEWEPVIAAPSKRRFNLVIHDFAPGSLRPHLLRSERPEGDRARSWRQAATRALAAVRSWGR